MSRLSDNPFAATRVNADIARLRRLADESFATGDEEVGEQLFNEAWAIEERARARAAERRRQSRQRPNVPDGLRTRAEAAAKLGCSLRTLDGHVESGALRPVNIGHGKQRARHRFADADLDEFINQKRKDILCRSTGSGARRSGTSISGGEVIAFTDLRRPRPGGKPKK